MSQLNTILIRLAEGHSVTLRFPSLEDRERFRVAIYKEKKDFDTAMYLIDQEYVVQSLRFKHSESESESESEGGEGKGEGGGGEIYAELSFYIPTKRDLRFEVLNE